MDIACAKSEWKSQRLDGAIYAEPLVYHGTVVVATENDSVYALNATSGGLVWRTNVGTPMNGSKLPCGDFNPSGVTGTPVIDASSGIVYAVAFETPGQHMLVALDLSDGKIRFTVSADPPGADPLVHQERGALALANGKVYIPYGGLAGDCGDYHGWVVGVNEDGSGSLVSYEVPTLREGGIWAPSGVAVALSGEVFITAGNGASSTTFDHGNAVIGLSPSLQQLSYFAPSDWSALNQGDTDLGSAGPLLIRHGEIFQIGKEGVGYILNATRLGGIGGQVYSGEVCASAFGGAAATGNLIFVACTDGLAVLNATQSSFKLLWRGPSFSSGPPIVTGGVVWTMDTGNGSLQGFDVRNGSLLFKFQTGATNRFTTPSAGDGRLIVASGMEVYGFEL